MINVLVSGSGASEMGVLRSLLRTGVAGPKIVVVTDDPKRDAAISEIRKIAEVMNTKVETVQVNPGILHEAVATIRRIVRDCVRSFGGAVVSLGGGMRALVIETLLAVLTLPIQDKKSVKIVVDLETSQGSIEFPASIPIDIRLSEVEMRVLRFVIERGVVELKDVSDGLAIARSTAWKALERLVSMECLRKEGYRYSPTVVGLYVDAIISSSR